VKRVSLVAAVTYLMLALAGPDELALPDRWIRA